MRSGCLSGSQGQRVCCGRDGTGQCVGHLDLSRCVLQQQLHQCHVNELKRSFWNDTNFHPLDYQTTSLLTSGGSVLG